MVTINGKKEDVAGWNLKEYLKASGYDINKVVVEVNRDIVSKNDLENICINEDDVIEVLSFVGGG